MIARCKSAACDDFGRLALSSHADVTLLTAAVSVRRFNERARRVGSRRGGCVVRHSSEQNVMMCPLCHGHGVEHKELLVVRWRSREFEQELQTIADEAAFGAGGMEDPIAHAIYNNETD